MIGSIETFAQQFSYVPHIERGEKLKKHTYTIVAGMGGSHLAAGIIKALVPGIELYVHRDYGVPPYTKVFMKRLLCIACSFSGNTEETLDFAQRAHAEGYSVAVLTSGGKLADFAEANKLPLIRLPKTIDGNELQPRMATAYMTLALLVLMGEKKLYKHVAALGAALRPSQYRSRGEALAHQIGDTTPLVYASAQNTTLAYQWKIKFNETAKIPAFYNIFPELNHNELNGFVGAPWGRYCVFMLQDADDHPRIQRRMKITAALYKDRGIDVHVVKLAGKNPVEKIFGALLIADWCALALAERAGVDPARVPLIEQFKKRLA